jgi:hypothetical protein
VPLDQGAQLDLIEDADGYRYTALATDTPPGSTPGWTPATRPRPGPGPHLLRPRVVRMVVEETPDHPSQWAAITAVAQKLGIGTAETLRSPASAIRAPQVSRGAGRRSGRRG